MKCKLFDIAAFGRRESVLCLPGREKLIRSARANIRKSVFLDASEINEAHNSWLNTGGDFADDLRRCIPPWENLFIYGGYEISPDGHKVESGVHCLTSNRYTKDEIPQGNDGIQGDVAEIIREGSRMVVMTSWMRIEKMRSKVFFMLPHTAVLRDDGSYVSSWGADYRQFGFNDSKDNWWSLALFTCQLVHCKNIITQEHPPYRPTMPKGKRNKSPKIKYHTLRISNSLVKSESRDSTNKGQEKPKHICRGKFAHYTEEKKLFGKYTGTFWRPMHIRGSANHGIVGKDYAMGDTA